MSAMRRSLQIFLALGALLVLVAARASDLAESGRRIYEQGLLANGAPLTGQRFGVGPVTGREAACALCHRRSGMGSVEGEFLVAPITANYLFQPSGPSERATMDQRRGKSFNLAHSAYDDDTLLRAIRSGLNADGRSLSDLMPRYAIPDQDMRALVAYLRSLNAQWSPGVTDTTVRLATIITPDVDETSRKVFLDMLQAIVRQKNASTVPGTQRGGRHHMTSAAELVLGTERKWELDIWELSGPEGTWRAQLDSLYQRKPVFAVLSGMGEGRWAPVHQFCEKQAIPCWFPIVGAPVVSEADQYSIYFSRGIALEADLLVRYLDSIRPSRPTTVLQLVSDSEVARAGARQFQRQLQLTGSTTHSREVGELADMQRALAQCSDTTVAVLWLTKRDVSLLQNEQVPACSRIFFSAELLHGHSGVPARWKGKSELIFPYEMPQRRVLNTAYLHHWLRQNRIPLVDEVMQSKLFFAANFMSDTVAELLDNLYRDYLLERAEAMIGRREGGRAEEEDHARQMQRRAAVRARQQSSSVGEASAPATMGLRQSTTVFPRLSLGPGQRLASKGGRIVRFVDAVSDTIVEASDWIAP